VNARQQPDEARVVNYLRNGVLLIGRPGMVGDVLDEAASPIGPPHIVTDGYWQRKTYRK
jgi:hypothetical protein